MKFSGRGFKFYSGQLSTDTSKDRSMVNNIYILCIYICLYISRICRYILYINIHVHNIICNIYIYHGITVYLYVYLYDIYIIYNIIYIIYII